MCNSVKKLMSSQQAQLVQKGILSIGDKLPDFSKKAVVTTEKGIEITDINRGTPHSRANGLCCSGGQRISHSCVQPKL